jgi:hypothetical protein
MFHHGPANRRAPIDPQMAISLQVSSIRRVVRSGPGVPRAQIAAESVSTEASPLVAIPIGRNGSDGKLSRRLLEVRCSWGFMAVSCDSASALRVTR